MKLKEFIEKSREKRLERLEERDAQKREDRQNGVKLPARILRRIKRTGVKTRIVAIALALILVVGAIFGVRIILRKNSGSEPGRDGFGPGGMDMSFGVTASGITTVGMVEETFDVDSLETTLEIEEVYLNNGDEVEKGAKILKISDESLEKARTELEQAAESAEYAYRLGVIDYEEEVLTAESTLEQASVNSKYAENDYNSDIQEKKEEVENLKKQVEEAGELVEEYTASVNDDYYYTYYNLGEMETQLYNNFTLLMKFYDEWNIAVQSLSETHDSNYEIYEAFEEEVTQEQEEYEQALEDYEDAVRIAANGLVKAQANLEKLQAQLSKAQVEYDDALTAANSTKTETVAQSEIAQATYDTAVEKAEEELATLKDAMDDAEDNLNAFNESISDGYMYTSTAGTIMMVAVSKGGSLSADSMVIAYTDESTISVSASVEQDYISQLVVGQAATVTFEDYGTYEGVITAINPNTASSSRSSVTYTVTVELKGDVSNLSQNLTATVTFDTDEEDESESGDN